MQSAPFAEHVCDVQTISLWLKRQRFPAWPQAKHLRYFYLLELAGERGEVLSTAMTHILQLVVGAILSLFGAAFLGWIVVRLVKNSEDPSGEIFKIIFSIALVAGETFLFKWLVGALHPSTNEAANFAPAFALVISLAA
ncbi:MAG: hypothetical protein ACREFE_14075, partial [Limisphaerales bacterium]